LQEPAPVHDTRKTLAPEPDLVFDHAIVLLFEIYYQQEADAVTGRNRKWIIYVLLPYDARAEIIRDPI
jgi:hypothetical protein